jgi:hypothetical protein
MTIKAHFDGKVFVPDEPVDIPAGEAVTLDVARPARKPATAADVLRAIQGDAELRDDWERIAAGRDSVEVARELRRGASTRQSSDDSR